MHFDGLEKNRVHASESAWVFRWETRLRWLEISFLILTIPAFYLELASGDAHSIVLGRWFYGVARIGTLATLLLLSRFSAHHLPKQRENARHELVESAAHASVQSRHSSSTTFCAWFVVDTDGSRL